MNNTVSGSSPYISLVPQVMQAQQLAQQQAVSIAVQSKAMDTNEAQGAALLNMLNSVAAAMEGIGTNFDAYA